MTRRYLIAMLLLFCWAAPAAAEVEIAFYSKDFASTFPHGFVRLTGKVDSTGETIETNYGFTPTRLSPRILGGPVEGRIETVSPVYVSRSVRHFSLKLSERQYRSILALVQKWRSLPQPSYRLGDRNCVHFVAEVATTLGLTAPYAPNLMKKPKSYLRRLTQQNAALIASWAQGRSLQQPTGTARAPTPRPSIPAQ